MIPFLLACAPPVLEIEASRDASGAVVEATIPLDRVEVQDASGAVVVARHVTPPSERASVRAPLPPGAYEVVATGGGQSARTALEVPDSGPFALHVEAPLGQDALPAGMPVDVPVGTAVRVGLVVTAQRDLALHWALGAETGERAMVAGERAVLTVDLGEHPVEGRVWAGAFEVPVRVEPRPLAVAEARERLALVGVALPARGDGSIDRTAPVGRIQLAAPWWDAFLDRFHLGFRPRDDQAPRTYVAATLANRSDRPINAVVTARVLHEGVPHPAFRPRLRDAVDLDTVRRLVRVPPGEPVSAALPVYVDRAAIPGPLEAEVELSVRALGSSDVLHEARLPLVVERGTPWASAALVLGGVGMLLGWLGIAGGLSRWLGRSTGQLTTVAVFGSLSFTVGAASQVLGLGLSSVLGPFAPFVLGLADDAVRMSLVAALLALVPRVGVFALATLVGWLMRALALGAVHPVDALYLGNTVFLTELALFATGVTRSDRWLDGPGWLAWARLAGGLAVPNALATGVALAVSVVLYRLYYAEWYVAATVLGPGLLYAAIGCALAVPFARSLRRVG
ncbi:MAG: hypothetical protein H6737_07795 [Alphaproteobacteria bacterium]|nr:hypothetical protein [Alphaproteobacteria bacterium]